MYTQALIKKTVEDLSQHISEKRLLFHVHESWFIFYILDYLDKNELINFSDTIRKSLESIFKTDRIDGRIAILEIKQGKDELNIDQLLKRLHIASERHNSFFGNNFETSFYDEDLEALINRERDITEALTDIALSDTTNDELFLQFQPILKLKTGSISSFEALARLKTEKLGLVSPLEFIPIAEKTKLIIPLGEKIIFKALSFLKELKDLGYNQIGISINISPIQLLSQGFIKSFFRTVDELQVDYSNVSIEITESVLVSDYNKINDLLDQLKKSGMNIAIDDFGTGYSSLAREQELRVDYLKIDKYFIDKLLEGDLSNSITSDIISIAHKLGHYAIAEGVEYMKQLQYLR